MEIDEHGKSTLRHVTCYEELRVICSGMCLFLGTKIRTIFIKNNYTFLQNVKTNSYMV